MKVIDKLASMQNGAIVTDKTILAVLKRKGLISDYSEWGYLEGTRVYYKTIWNGRETTDYEYFHTFPKGNGREAENFETCEDYDELRERFGCEGLIKYKGFEFSYRYLDGCFSPYLQLIYGGIDKRVNPTMSVWGTIV